ncbi:hypothetical protein BH11ACT5_BH11ACT5_06370 [soil metagenome]
MADTPGEPLSGTERMRQVVRFWRPENLLNGPVFAVSFALTALAHFNVADDPVQRPAERLGLLIAVHTVMFALVWLATKAAPRLFASTKGWLALACAVTVASLARAILLAGLLDVLRAGEPLLAQRILYSLVTPTSMLLVLTALWGAFVEHAATVRRLAQVREQLAEDEESIETAESDLSAQNLAALRVRLRSALVGLTDSVVDPRIAAALLRESIDTVVRPVTRNLRLANDIVPMNGRPAPGGVRARFDLRAPALDALDLRNAWPVVVPAFALIQALPAAIDAIGPVGGPAQAIVSVLSAQVVLLLGRRAALRWRGRWSRLLHIPVAALAGAVSYAVGAMLNGTAPTALWTAVLFFTGCSYLLALAHASFLRAADSRAELAADNVRLAHRLTRRRAEVHVRRSSVARALHGTAQALLTAAFLRLQLAVNSGSETDIAVALDSARDDAARAVECVREGPIDRRPIVDVVAQLNETWDELATVSLSTEPATVDRVGSDPLCSALLTELLPELVFNAIKHSDAASISVGVDWPENDSLRVVLDHDHRPSSPQATPSGLGDRTLDEVCLSWSRHFDDARGRTEIVLPWRATALADQT